MVERRCAELMFKKVVLLGFSVQGGFELNWCDNCETLVFAIGGVPCNETRLGANCGCAGCAGGAGGGGFMGDLVGSLTGESESSMNTGVLDGLNGDELADIVSLKQLCGTSLWCDDCRVIDLLEDMMSGY